MIDFDDVTFRYQPGGQAVLDRVDLHLDEGELCLVVGETGSGKSTLLRAINGLVPHFTGGELSGRVTVAGRNTRDFPPRELADVVGVVLQDPMSGFVTDMVEDELAYGMESLGLPRDAMRKRVEETLDLMGLAELRNRPLLSLSGGQRQRVAIGSVLTAHPQVIVLDEPTSALDPGAAEEVLAALQRLVHDLGMTVVLAEHRLERVVQYADRVVVLESSGTPDTGTPAAMMALSPVAPPVVQLGRLAGWSPLPVSVRDARRLARNLRADLARVAPAPDSLARPGAAAQPESQLPPAAVPAPRTGLLRRRASRAATRAETRPAPVLQCRRVTLSYGPVPALVDASLQLQAGSVVALMGRNGAGKSTLLKAAVGLLKPVTGEVRVAGHDPAGLRGVDLLRQVGFVPQEPADVLCEDSVRAECRAADTDSRLAAGTTAALLAEISPEVSLDAHPGDLSEGQRLSLVLALMLAPAPPLLLLDEPTRGLDYGSKARLVTVLRRLAHAGTAVLMATHDVELVAEVADRVVILADGEVVADGPTREIVTASPIFAPQVAKIMAPEPWLTVDDVAAAMAVAQ
ncbi:MAG: ATP-binding cassette domain-containing protein [Actinobacteria bacterium]|nr:ATP-binding cassette domain-containing protein [Actinomycetota bacterium]